MIDVRRWFRGSQAADATDRFGFAVVGLGRIAEHFLRGLQDSPTVRVTALVSGDTAKAAKLAARYGVGYTCGYGDLPGLRDRADVDGVYIALPVSMHREFAALAAMAGKHVLVEKPMAGDATESCDMVANCRAAGVLLSVAYRCPFEPMHQRLRELIRAGALGRVESIHSEFGFELQADDWRFDPARAGGGSAYDVGVYPLNAARYLMDAEPEITGARATVNGNGLETAIEWTMRFPNGVEGRAKSSYTERLPGSLTVRGTGGELTLAPAYSHREPVRLSGWYTDAATGKRVEMQESTPRGTPSHFRMEAEHLADCARTGTPLWTPGEDGLCDMKLIETMYRMAGVPLQH